MKKGHFFQKNFGGFAASVSPIFFSTLFYNSSQTYVILPLYRILNGYFISYIIKGNRLNYNRLPFSAFVALFFILILISLYLHPIQRNDLDLTTDSRGLHRVQSFFWN